MGRHVFFNLSYSDVKVTDYSGEGDHGGSGGIGIMFEPYGREGVKYYVLEVSQFYGVLNGRLVFD